MNRTPRLLLVLGATLSLTGCYYDPDYGYVRNGSGGDAYYGTETTTTVVSPGYYDPGYSYYGGYGYGPGCCYSTIGVGGVWYRDRYYRRDHDWHGRYPGGWHGGYGDHRPPPGGWHGHDGDHRPPSGGWSHGGDDHRPSSGGWHGGGDHSPSNRPSGSRPSGGWHGGGSHGSSGRHGDH